MTRTKTLLALTIVLLAVSGIWYFSGKENTPENETRDAEKEERVITVTTQKAGNLKSATFEERFPARVAPANETLIIAKTSGTISSISFEVGEQVALGEVLVSITDPTGATFSKSGLQSEAVRQAEIEVSLARKSYKEAKRLAEKNTNKESYLARDLARLRLESAEIELGNALDASIVRAPLSGIVSEKSVGIGSSVTPGTAIARIASSGMPKARFQVSESFRPLIKTGDSARVHLGENRQEPARVISIASIADPATGKFLVEARLEKAPSISGTIATVSLQTTRSTPDASEFFLPLSALTTSQDGSFFFIVENEIAKKIAVASLSVSGETALVRADIPGDANVIIESAGTLEDGMKIRVSEE